MSLVDPLPQSPTVCHDGLDGLHGISPKLDTGRRRKKKKISPVALWSSRREREQQASKSVRSWKLDTKREGLSTTLPALGLGLSGDRRPCNLGVDNGHGSAACAMMFGGDGHLKRGAEKQGPSVFMVHPKVQLGGGVWGKTLFVATHGGGGGGGGGHFSFSDE